MRISTTNHPLPPAQVSTVSLAVVFNDISVWFQPYIITFVQTIGLAIVVAWFPIFVARERITKMKHLQVVIIENLFIYLLFVQLHAGLNPFALWLGHLIFDVLTYMVVVLSLMIMYAAFSVSELWHSEVGWIE